MYEVCVFVACSAQGFTSEMLDNTLTFQIHILALFLRYIVDGISLDVAKQYDFLVKLSKGRFAVHCIFDIGYINHAVQLVGYGEEDGVDTQYKVPNTRYQPDIKTVEPEEERNKVSEYGCEKTCLIFGFSAVQFRLQGRQFSL